MARSELIDSGNALNDKRPSIDLKVGAYAYVAVHIKGTSASGQTLAKSNLQNWRIRLVRNGEQVMGGTFDFFNLFPDLKNGRVRRTFATAGTNEIVLFLPAWYMKPNVMDIRSKEEADLYLEFDSSVDTIFAGNSFDWKVYGVYAPDVPERYQLFITEQNISASASGVVNETLDQENIAAIVIEDDSSVVNKIQVMADGELITNNIDDDFLNILTNLENAIEASDIGLTEINYVPSGRFGEAVNKNNVSIVDFSGAGTLRVNIFHVRAVDNEASIARVQQRRASQLAKNKQLASGRNIVRNSVGA